MDEQKVFVVIICILVAIGLFGVVLYEYIELFGVVLYEYPEDSLPEYEQSKYTQNKIIRLMSIEEYNQSYDELSIPEKEHIIREYQINKEVC